MSTAVMMAKKVCAWCRVDMGTVPWSSMTRETAPPVTHGVCAACEKKVLKRDDSRVTLRMVKKDGVVITVTTTWYQALLRLDFAIGLPDFDSYEITEVA